MRKYRGSVTTNDGRVFPPESSKKLYEEITADTFSDASKILIELSGEKGFKDLKKMVLVKEVLR